jgi:protein involved in polysaccharide export with SLBB domain
LTLVEAIAMAGGPQRKAKTNEIHILRKKEGGQDNLKFNYDAIRKGKEPNVELKPFDIIEVGEAGLFTNKGLSDLFKSLVSGGASSIMTRGIIY